MAKKPKICLIYTGGTIGMTKKTNGTVAPPEHPDDFFKIAPEMKEIVDFDFVLLLNKDSTNMNPDDWVEMAKSVYNRRNAGYAGFVIAHGTDTMHFSSSALSFALGPNLNFPVVFTGAQTIPAVKHGDSRVNLLRACKLATMDLAEVVICFGDYIFRGCRAQKKDEKKFDAFESPAYFPIGYITEEIELSPLAEKKRRVYDIVFIPNFEKGILLVNLIPGLEPELFRPIIENDQCNGVILQSFGAGNVPHEDNLSFIPLIEEAKKLNKPVIITSQFPGHSTLGTEYEAGKVAHEAGAIPTGNMTSSAAVVKFRWVLAQVFKEIQDGYLETEQKIKKVKELMNTPYVGEMDHMN
ncbi:asparaginase [Acidobacteriota bacterium]